MRLFLIAVFGVMGIYARYFAGILISRWAPSPFPWGTFAINITGAFVIGLVFVIGVEKASISEDVRVGIMVGFLGGYTTFSSYALEAVRLAENSERLLSFAYLFGSPITGFIAAMTGLYIARALPI